jgi:hypothetical protein
MRASTGNDGKPAKKRRVEPRPPGGNGIEPCETEAQWQRQHAKRLAEAAARKAADAKTAEAVEQAIICLEPFVKNGLFDDRGWLEKVDGFFDDRVRPEEAEARGWAERVEEFVEHRQHEDTYAWLEERAKRLRERRDAGGEDNLLLEYIRSALIVADKEDGRRWNATACAWVEKLPGTKMPPYVRDYLAKFLPSFQKAMEGRRQRKSPGAIYRRGVVAEVVELVSWYFGLERRRASATYLTAGNERTRAESGTSIVQKALSKLGVEKAEDTVRDHLDEAQEAYAVPLGEWLCWSSHSTGRALSEVYKMYQMGALSSRIPGIYI